MAKLMMYIEKENPTASVTILDIPAEMEIDSQMNTVYIYCIF